MSTAPSFSPLQLGEELWNSMCDACGTKINIIGRKVRLFEVVEM